MKYLRFFILVAFLPLFTFSQDLKEVDEIAPFSEGLAGVRKGNEWGFINASGELVIPFRDDLVWSANADPNNKDITGIRYPQFQDGRCMVQSMLEEEEIYTYGFIDKKGALVIAPEYLNVTPFNQGYAVGILMTKNFRGKNNFQLNIYDYKFSEVLLDTKGDIMRLITQRDNILMSKRRYELPELNAKFISPELMAVKTASNTWELRKIDLQ